MTLHHTLETGAILDQKWCHNKLNNHSVLATVNADNTLDIYELNSDEIKLNLITSYINNDPDDKDVMLLSLDWSTGKYSNAEPTIVASDTKGRINVFRYYNSSIEKITSFPGHEFEAWICAFYYWDTSILFSGGDDAKLLQYDLRVSNEPVTINKSHIAGVTCMHSNSEKEYLLATGSYDAHLLLWDIRNMKKYNKLIEMPGPMWRLKWDPLSHDYLLAACMLGGFHVVDTVSDEMKLLSYYEHTDLAYGSDWSHLNELEVKNYGNAEGNRIIGTCSFYDKKLCVSKVEIKF